jgi:ferrous iron transport protein A
MFGRSRRGGPHREHPPGGTNSIAALLDGEKATIKEIHGGAHLEARLMNMGLRPGKQITRVGSMPAGGPITVECDGFRVAIGRGIAHRVKVDRFVDTPASDEP